MKPCKCLAAFWAVFLLRPYLKGFRFSVQIDHDALVWTINLTGSAGKLVLWPPQLSELEFDGVDLVAMKHQTGDSLSRLRTTETD